MFQLVLDRGQLVGWFDSTEIWIEAGISATAFYLFLVHSFTAENPFVNLSLFRDTNYLLGNFYAFVIGALLFGTMALLPPMLEELMGYPASLIGYVSAPRGLAMMFTMFFAGRLMGRVDTPLMILTGLLLSGLAMYMMARVNLEMDAQLVVVAGMVHGVGTAIMFVPVATVLFLTIPRKDRNEAAAVSSLIRNMSGAIGISVLHTMTIRNTETVRARLAEGVRPDNPVLILKVPDLDFLSPARMTSLDIEVLRQALMVAYSDTYWFLAVACFIAAPLVLFLRR